MHNAIVHYPLAEPRLAPLPSSPPVYTLGMGFTVWKNPFIQPQSPIPAMLPPGFLSCSSSLAKHHTHTH